MGNQRSALEALYFLAGIGIFAACYAAKQVRIASDQIKTAKEIATANSRRESVKLAGEHCRYYAEGVLSTLAALLTHGRGTGNLTTHCKKSPAAS